MERKAIPFIIDKLKFYYLKSKYYLKNRLHRFNFRSSPKQIYIDDIWKDYAKKIGNVVLYQRDIKQIHKNQISHLISLNKVYKNNKHLSKIPLSAHNMSFIDPYSHESIVYNVESISVEERFLQLTVRKNREYQFLLMEAYEIFEDTIEEIYAYLGMKDFNFWPLKEIKGSTKENLARKDFNFFKTKASERKGGAIRIATKLIDYFKINPKIDNVSLKQRIIFIEKLRHIIVHKRGYISNPIEFTNKVAIDSGTYNNNNINQSLIDYIKFHVSKKEYGNFIILDEYPIPTPFPIGMEHNRFENLINNLMICVYLIIKNAKNPY